MRLIVLMLVVGCTPRNVRDVLGMAPDLAGDRVVILEPALLAELESAPDDMSRFRAGTWVGTIWFDGGYEIMAEEQNQVRSVNVALSGAESFTPQGRTWATKALSDAAQAAGWQVVPSEAAGWRVGAPTRTTIRGTVKHDGDDNLNLPRFDLAPGPITTAEGLGADAVIAPVLVHYYAHNAGWFVGQEKGSWAGARVRVLWSLHAADDGRVLGWGDVGTRGEQEKLASPNQQQLQDLLLMAESEAEAALVRQLQGKGKGG